MASADACEKDRFMQTGQSAYMAQRKALETKKGRLTEIFKVWGRAGGYIS